MAVGRWLCLFGSCILFVSTSAAHTESKVTDNPADELVAEINNNRTAQKSLPALVDNPGLACIALQYIKAYQGDCGVVGGENAKKPEDSAIAETFAPKCGVLTSSLAPVTGRLLGCQSKYVKPKEAFSNILMENGRAVEIVHSKNHTEVGAAVSGSDGGSPYFWCVLFSNGTSNSSFSLEGGVAKLTRPGCFSGANDDCGSSYSWSQTPRLWLIASGSLAVGYAFGVGSCTALPLAKCLRKFLSLDLSWCHRLADGELGLIVDSCLSLKLLKLFGYTQGHTNRLVPIIGLNSSSVIEHMYLLADEQVLLRYSPLPIIPSESQNVDL